MFTNNIIIDTDVGCDDCMAIAMALLNKETKVHAITSVFGNVSAEQSAVNIATILKYFGKEDIPFFLGSNTPLISSDVLEQWIGHGPNGLGGTTFEEEIRNLFTVDVEEYTIDTPFDKLIPTVAEEHAVNALIRMVREKPGFYDIIALGPLTNLALAIKMDPKFAHNVKSIWWMGGSVIGQGNCTMSSEFNAHADPEAVKVVLENVRDENLTVVPLELCTETGLLWTQYDEWCMDVHNFNIKTATDGQKLAYFMKRSTKYYELYVRGSYQWKDMDPEYPNEPVTSDHLYCPCDVYCVLAYLHKDLIQDVLITHSAVETQGAVGRGYIAVDFYKFKQKGCKHKYIRKMKLPEFTQIFDRYLKM